MSRASSELDVVIVGAGVAGLTALRELQQAGLEALCLEARDRIGGRILTVHDPLSPIPIELGAEFIHGRAREIWDILSSAGLAAYDCGEKAVHIKKGKVQKGRDAWEQVDKVMQHAQRAASKGRDRTFASFLAKSSHPEDAKRLAAAYVEGFNAAHQDVIGIASLAQDARAADEIDGDRSFRVRTGYDSLANALLGGSNDVDAKLKLNSVVEKIVWRRGSAAVHVRSPLDGRAETFHCRRVVVTVPLGVLQAEPGAPGAIRFDPEPTDTISAARKLRFGQVIRVVMRFGEAFWEERHELADAGFLFSEEQFFPTWWTPLPVRAPVLTGWSAGPHADELLGQPQAAIIEHALQDLARITRVSPKRLSELLQNAYSYPWHTDPFARGAYSYVPAGALPARAALAKTLEHTLFFAGEATELNGHSATVHGAIAAGKRAAQEILEHLR